MQNLLNCKGRRFSATIKNNFSAECKCQGKIQIENKSVYLCQDTAVGDNCLDKLGFKYSWSVYDGSEENLKISRVSNFKLLDKTLDECEGGDILIDRQDQKRKVLERINDLFFLSHPSCHEEMGLIRTISEIKRNKWTIENTEETQEVTIEQIAEKFGVDPKQIRIKDYEGE